MQLQVAAFLFKFKSMEELEELRDATTYCNKHVNSGCRVFPARTPPRNNQGGPGEGLHPALHGKLLMNGSGIVCVDWSTASHSSKKHKGRQGWLGDSLTSCMLWARERLVAREHVIVAECVPGFDSLFFFDIMNMYLAKIPGCDIKYKWEELVFSTGDIGFPSGRRRKYMVGLRKGGGMNLVWHDAVKDSVSESFMKIFKKEIHPDWFHALCS